MTIVLPESLALRLRRVVRERYDGRKGAISGLIADALDAYLSSSERSTQSEVFRALRGHRVVAEGSNLDELAKQLREKGLNPRDLRIISSKKLAPVAKAGFRAKIV